MIQTTDSANTRRGTISDCLRHNEVLERDKKIGFQTWLKLG